MPPPTILIFALVGVATLSLYNLLTPSNFSYRHFISGMPPTQAPWTSPYSGYLARAEALPEFEPTRSALKLAVLRNAPADPEGFTLAFFAPGVAVDAKGSAYTLTKDDYEGILSLAESVKNLPKTGGFRNLWRVKQDRTSQPIERILSPKPALTASPSPDGYEAEYVETSVYGFDKRHRLLKEPVDGYTELPEDLWELTGLGLEARETSGERNELVLDRVRAVLGDVF
ncbi:hypothetical protein NLJ89_g6838 [Agrocybe chaxingu]|uniref:Uncharacterized protein n=1 Tax=Agrocybe chaxingu TaxID=84603 RepID=A0A9W8JYH1_9AGAR|nr:hypothetical protein NLJ89_g6838 [Agrocybe chaxingu]